MTTRFHSHIHIVSTPYSYSCKRFPNDAEDQLEAAMGASHSLKAAHGTVFRVYDLFPSVSFDNGVSLNVRLEIYVQCYIPPLEISLTGCMLVKRSNTRMLYIYRRSGTHR
jgi:hypothetical protein